ncbi:MAG: cation:proton antiporter [Deltaproteobacteria bacterium]|nr:cation:proton antiporter [Deltaproteobacteria bacterium]
MCWRGCSSGPHVPVPLVADAAVVETLSELGVILLMFCIGLEFTLKRFMKVAPVGGLIGLAEVSLMAWLGFQAAGLLGWTTPERLFTGAIVAISSTSIIAKAFEEKKVTGPWRDTVLSVLIVEDVLAILLMVVLGLVAGGQAVAPERLGWELFRLVASLGTLLAAGLLVLPRAFRLVQRLDRPETTVVAAVGVCFATSLIAQELGYSVALGAFMGGGDGGRVGARRGHRARDPPGAGRVRGAVFCRRRDAHQPRARVGEHRRGHPAHPRRGLRQAPRRGRGELLRGHGPPRRGAGGHDPHPDRRVLVHHRGLGQSDGRGGGAASARRRGGLGDHGVHDADRHRQRRPPRDLDRPPPAAVSAAAQLGVHGLGGAAPHGAAHEAERLAAHLVAAGLRHRGADRAHRRPQRRRADLRGPARRAGAH